MNLIFAPVFMALHRVTDTYIDRGEGQIEKIIGEIDGYGFISFVLVSLS